MTAPGTRHYCMVVDRNYVTSGLTLHQSLMKHSSDPFKLWVLSMDNDSQRVLDSLALPNICVIPNSELESFDQALLTAKKNRSHTEYCMTCKAAFQLFLLHCHPEIDLIVYLDADQFFFSDPRPIFEEFDDHSILIVGHKFPESLRYYENVGLFNSGFLAVRNDHSGKECLNWWHDRCLNWCYLKFEDGRFTDQKYLDEWPLRFLGVHVLQHKGAMLAPWNWMNYCIEDSKDGCKVDGEQLIFFHFQGLIVVSPWLLCPSPHFGLTSRTVLNAIYEPYLRSLQINMRLAANAAPAIPSYMHRKPSLRFLVGRLLRNQLVVAI